MNSSEAPDPATSAYVESLLGSTGMLMQILDHMVRYPDAAPDAPPPHEVLAGLLEDILDAELASSPGEVEAAARILDATARVVSDELFLVPAEPPPNRAERRRKRRGGDCGRR